MSSAMPLDAGEFALRCKVSQGAAAYLVFLVPEASAPSAIQEIREELEAMLGNELEFVDRVPAKQLIKRLPGIAEERALIVDASGYQSQDWSLLDRQRSALQRSGVTVFLATATGFEELMRNAPNLASWLGAEVFALPGSDAREQERAIVRQQRLDALLSWSGLSREAVIEQAIDKRLPRDPEYAELLVLLGRGDLLGE